MKGLVSTIDGLLPKTHLHFPDINFHDLARGFLNNRFTHVRIIIPALWTHSKAYTSQIKPV